MKKARGDHGFARSAPQTRNPPSFSDRRETEFRLMPAFEHAVVMVDHNRPVSFFEFCYFADKRAFSGASLCRPQALRSDAVVRIEEEKITILESTLYAPQPKTPLVRALRKGACSARNGISRENCIWKEGGAL